MLLFEDDARTVLIARKGSKRVAVANENICIALPDDFFVNIIQTTIDAVDAKIENSVSTTTDTDRTSKDCCETKKEVYEDASFSQILQPVKRPRVVLKFLVVTIFRFMARRKQPFPLGGEYNASEW